MSETLKKLENIEGKAPDDELIVIEPDAAGSVPATSAAESTPNDEPPITLDLPASPATDATAPAATLRQSNSPPAAGHTPEIEIALQAGQVETVIDIERAPAPEGSSRSSGGTSSHAPATGMLHALQQQRRELLRRGQSLRDDVIRSRVLGAAANASPRMKRILFTLAATLFIASFALIARDLVRRYRQGASKASTETVDSGPAPISIPGLTDTGEKEELTWEERYQAALSESQRGNIDTAIVQLRSLQEQRPDDMAVPTSLSLIYQRMQKWTDAQRVLIEAQARNPASGLPYNNLGMIALRQGQIPLATKLLEKSVQHDIRASRGEPLINLARAYELGSQWQKAKMTYEKYLILPGHDERYSSLVQDRIKKLEPFAANEDAIEEQQVRTIVRRPAEQEQDDDVIDNEADQNSDSDQADSAGAPESNAQGE